MLDISNASPDDLAALVELERTIFHYDLISPKQMRYLLQSPSAVVCKAVFCKTVVGYLVVLTRRNSTVGRLYSIGVRPEARALGIGRSLLYYAECITAGRGCNRVHLEVHAANDSALRFYQHAGYSLFGQRENYYSDGALALRLRKFIPCGEVQYDSSSN